MAVHEVTLFVETREDKLTVMEYTAIGRDAAQAILQYNGTVGMDRTGERANVTSVRFLRNQWWTERYIGAEESEDWAVTQSELDDWAERNAEDDEW